MRLKHITTSGVFLLTALFIVSLLAWRYTHNTQTLQIKNMANDGYEISYFTSPNSRVLHASNYLNQAQTAFVGMQNNSLLHSTQVNVAIGSKGLDEAYCQATIIQPAFGKHAKFTHHHGHCSTHVAADGDLSLVVGQFI